MMTVRGQVRAQPARHRRRGRRRRRRHRRLGELLRAGTQARRHRHEPAAGPQLRGTGGAHPHQPHLRNPVGHPGRDNPEAGTPADRPAGIRGAAGRRQEQRPRGARYPWPRAEPRGISSDVGGARAGQPARWPVGRYLAPKTVGTSST